VDALYDSIGRGYARSRKPEPRIERELHKALANAKSVVNVGAGAGSYEPPDRDVVAVEISETMIRQRPAHAAPVVQASAMQLPFESGSFDAALAVLTVHHWPDAELGLNEMRRVARERVVVFTWDPTFPGFWLCDYFPEIMNIDRPQFPKTEDFEAALGALDILAVPIPHDCRDGFMCAYWRRPQAYLDDRVRAAISTFSKIGDPTAGLRALRSDLEKGRWHEQYGELLDRTELDLGYRVVIAC